jgi:Tol biopolymer transport system component/predicted Ser/Thr protein kinase
MTVAAGTRLGTYDVVAPLGVGGMGEVYRAHDSKLGRDVALKVLPADLAADPERRRRFEQEARAASGLNHPNVVHVYDVGGADGSIFIAMELVEGRTLRDLMSSGPLPARKFLDIAIQIADGLARAHEAGIVHRDLKPENVMVSKDGHVRILDFGLAKLVEPRAADQHTDFPTSPQMTRAGLVMGTVGYMSPEQAAGRPVDFRSDQFSLGVVLYELASGKRPFQRETGAETLTAILRDSPPPLATAAPALPLPLRWMIDERCLAKDPEDRYASTRDLLQELRGVRDHLSDVSGAVPAVTRRRRASWAIPLAALAAGVALGAVVHDRVGGATPSATPVLKRVSFRRGTIASARFAPDGQTIVYGAAFTSRPMEVYSTRIDSHESRALDLPQGGLFAIASTGEMAVSIGQHTLLSWERTGTLARVPLAGGAPREILEDVEEADWSPDGRRLAVVRDLNGVRRLEYPIEKVLYSTAGYISHIRVSPTGDRVAFLDHPVRGDNAGIVGMVDETGRKKTLGREFLASDGLAWSPSGQEIWFAAARSGSGTKNDLWAVAMDGKDRLLWREAGPVSLRDVSRDGRVILGRQNQGREIFGVAPGETAERELTWLDWSYPIDLSADGKTLLFEEEGEGAGETYAIYVRGTDGSAAVRLGEGRALSLAPDGKSVLGLNGGSLVLLRIGAGTTRTLSLGSLTCQTGSFLPDGKQVLVAANMPERPARLYVISTAGGAPRPISEEGVSLPLSNSSRRVSPDGQWIAAVGPDRRGVLYPIAGGTPRPIPNLAPDDVVIRWTPDGRSLYVYKQLVHARIELLDLATGRRTPWKELAPADPAGVASLSSVLIAPDGKSYVYSYSRLTEDLYLADGLK